MKQAVAELIKIQFAFTSFKFKLQYIWNEAYNLLEVFFCLQVDEPITGGGGLINGGVYRQQFLPRGVLTSIRFCWVCAAGLSDLLPHYSHFCGQIIDAIHWHLPISLLLGSTHPPREFLVLVMTSIFNFLIINSLKESVRGCLNWHK